MTIEAQFAGGLFSADVEDGRAGAQLWFGHEAVHARTLDGQSFELPFSQCQLERGGASGKLWFLRTPDRSLTLFCEAPGFEQALEEAAGRTLGPQLSALQELHTRQARRRLGGWLLALTAACAVLFAGLWGIRQAGRASVDLLPISADEQLGRLAFENMELGGSPSTDPVVNGAVEELVRRLAPHAPHALKGFRFRVRVVQASTVNAFALPGGYIVVYTGLLRAAETGEQVAGVLAHEMVHVTARHGMRRIAQSLGWVAAIQLLLGDVSGLAAIAVELLRAGALHSYSRDQEREADAGAVPWLARAELAPDALAAFLTLLEKDQAQLPSALSWLGTHPELAERSAAIRHAAAKLARPKQTALASSWPELRRRLGASDPLPAVAP